MRTTKWIDKTGIEHKQSMVFTKDDRRKPPVSKYGGRLKKGQSPPNHVGLPKGLHQVLWERQLVEENMAVATITLTNHEVAVHEWLLENEGLAHESADNWQNVCGGDDSLQTTLKGCGEGIVKNDPDKRCLVLCDYCYFA